MEKYAFFLFVIGMALLVIALTSYLLTNRGLPLLIPATGWFLYSGFVWYIGVYRPKIEDRPVRAEDGMWDIVVWPILIILLVVAISKTLQSKKS